MNRSISSALSLLISLVLCVTTRTIHAEDLLLFVSAFAPMDEGGIHAFQLSTDNGELKQVHRTPSVPQPFFMALSPNGNYLYATTASGQFGGSESEQVAAFEIVGNGGELKPLNRQSTLGSASCYLDVDETG